MSTFCDKYHMESTFKESRNEKHNKLKLNGRSMIIGRGLRSVIDLFFDLFNKGWSPGLIVPPPLRRGASSPLWGPASPSSLSVTVPLDRRISFFITVIPLRAAARAARAFTVTAAGPMGRRCTPVVTPY